MSQSKVSRGRKGILVFCGIVGGLAIAEMALQLIFRSPDVNLPDQGRLVARSAQGRGAGVLPLRGRIARVARTLERRAQPS
jgi:hypothetical protein